MKSKLKNFSLLTISTLIMAVGIYFFKFANNFTFGGITGIAVLVAKFLPISASDFSFVVNILLLIIGWIVLGKSFAEKTAYSTILLSVSLSLLERIYPMSHPLTNEPLLELIFAILLPALGSAILFNIGASSGGTDVIAMIPAILWQKILRCVSLTALPPFLEMADIPSLSLSISLKRLLEVG